jgi:hypothetical protein
MKVRRKWLVVVVSAGTALLAPLAVPVFIPWSDINSLHQDINIKTGQARYRRSVWFVTVSETIEETPISAALGGEPVDVGDIEGWHRVNTLSPGVVRHSPHYKFHSALHQAQDLNLIFEMLQPSAEQRREIAKTLLALWQMSGCDSGADEYLKELRQEATGRSVNLDRP